MEVVLGRPFFFSFDVFFNRKGAKYFKEYL
jgi:hypothetical protein